ncbi:hypothetical protein HY025_01575 [Candidatus Daviesbacteria bacterium]|nr:hypothetical protein [Candidatus Daviesbacteria bacterium]
MLQTKMPKGFVFIPVLIGVILLGIVGGAYVYFSQKNSNSQIIQQPLQPNIIPTPVSSQPIPTGSPAANCSTNWPGASSVYSGPTSPLKVCFSDWKIGGLGSI